MIDIGLLLWGTALMVETFTGYIMVEQVGMQVESLFPFLMMLVGMVFLFLSDKEKKRILKSEMAIYQGYENLVYFASYIIIVGICLAIILNIYHTISMVSPVLMLTWLLPMISYSMYQAVLVFDKKDCKIASKRVFYKDIVSIKIEIKKRNRACLYVNCKHKNYYYHAKSDKIMAIKESLLMHNRRIKIQ